MGVGRKAGGKGAREKKRKVQPDRWIGEPKGMSVGKQKQRERHEKEGRAKSPKCQKNSYRIFFPTRKVEVSVIRITFIERNKWILYLIFSES